MTLLLKISLFALVLPLVLGGTCPNHWTTFNGHCYRLYRDMVTWQTARTRCQQNSAKLVSINSSPENDFVSYLSSGLSDSNRGNVTWIGLGPYYHSQNPKRWLDGNTMTYTRWESGEPNNSGNNEGCIQTNWNVRGEWNDAPCNRKHQYLCETNE